MAFTGDFRSLTQMMGSINKLGFAVRNRVAIAVKDEMNVLLEEQFDQGIGPDGEPWAPLRPSTLRRGRTPPPLSDTRKMRGDVRAVRVGTNVAIESEVPAGFHQHGTSRMAARPMWPEGDMPERWSVRVALAANEGLLQAIGYSGLQAAE